MSEQNKSNFQAFGAGLLGFVAVMAVGGGALVLHSSHQAKAPPKPVAAAEPIDLNAATPPEPAAPGAPQKERRADSPAPLMGSDEETEIAEAPAAAQAVAASAPAAAAATAATSATAEASSPESAPNTRPAAQRLQTTQHSDLHGSAHSSAAAVAANPEPVARKGLKPGGAKRPLAKLAPQTNAPAPSIASVHYGVTSRDELMGRAAGPVYNIKGASAPAKAKPGEGGKLASDMNQRLAELQGQLDDNPALSPAQREEIQKELTDLKKGVSDVGGTKR
jgi:hypothetical protein